MFLDKDAQKYGDKTCWIGMVQAKDELQQADGMHTIRLMTSLRPDQISRLHRRLIPQSAGTLLRRVEIIPYDDDEMAERMRTALKVLRSQTKRSRNEELDEGTDSMSKRSKSNISVIALLCESNCIREPSEVGSRQMGVCRTCLLRLRRADALAVALLESVETGRVRGEFVALETI